jgi:hypothetical protein
MAVRTWANALGIAAGAGVLAGAGQLGIGYGLGILRFDQDFPAGAPWPEQLAWVTFLAIAAVVGGALGGAWRLRRLGLAATLPVRAALALAAGVGAAVMIPLLVRPAGAAHLAEAGSPQVAVALAAVAGLLTGVVAAFAVLSVPAVSGNVVSYVLWLWIAALISAAWTIGRGASWASARLGLLPATGLGEPVVLLIPPVLIGFAVAAVARFGGGDKRAVAASGLAGPLLLGIAYLAAGPGGGEHGTAYRYALIGIAVGLAVSVLTGLVRRPVRKPATEPAPTPAPVEPAWEPGEGTDVPAATVPASIRTASEITTASLWPDAAQDGDPTPEDTEAPPKPTARPKPERPKSTRARRATETAKTEAVKPTEAPPAPEPAPAAPASAPAQAPEPPEPATGTPEVTAKSGRGFRLGRRDRSQAGAPSGGTASGGKKGATEDEYEDWVKGLGAEPPSRLDSGKPARHAKPGAEGAQPAGGKAHSTRS